MPSKASLKEADDFIYRLGIHKDNEDKRANVIQLLAEELDCAFEEGRKHANVKIYDRDAVRERLREPNG